MNNLKRFLALALAMCMMLTAVPFGALAANDGIATASVTLGTKPANGTVTGEPFNDDASLSDSTSATHTNYRIPGMVMLNDGTLVASADIRYEAEYDGGGSDIVVSISEDDGKTWNYSVVAYLGDQGNAHAYNASTMMDPVIITDGTKLYLLYDMFPAGYSLSTHNTTYAFSATGTGFDSQGRLLLGTTYNSTTCNYYLENGKIYASDGTEQSGYTVDEWFNVSLNGTYVSNLFFAESPFYAYPTSYACMQTSTDGGKNWSNPEMLKTKHSGTAWQVLGPGSGIVTSSGELAFTVYNSDSSISLVHGTPGDWTAVKTSAANNESSVVELSDGTIRAFVKNGSNAITYVDFTKSGDSYTAGSAVSTGITNTGWCMISSMVYSKKIDGKEVILVCCPASSSLRCYGNVFAFTVDPTTKAMTKVGSYQINTGYSDQFFAYSDMAELEDGTIALLYEDGCNTYASAPWNGSEAGSGYSHIAYATVDPVKDLALTFDTNDIVLYVDQTTEITLTENVGSGNQSNNVADVTWTGVTTTENYLQAQKGTISEFTGEKTNLSNCLYTFTKVSESDSATTWVISHEMADGTKVYVHAHDGLTNYPNRTSSTNVVISNPTSEYDNATDGPFVFTGDGSNRSIHFRTNIGGYYWDQCSSAHDENNSNGTHGLFIMELNGTTLTQLTSTSEIQSGKQYLIAGKGKDGSFYVMNPTTDASQTYAQVAKVLSEQGTESKSSTTISITGKAVGTTTVDIGGTTYTITVKSDAKEITLDVGENYTDTIDGAAYTKDNATVADSSIATIDKVESTSVAGTKELVEVTNASSFAADKKYLIVSNRAVTNEPNYSVLTNDTYTSGNADWLGTITGLAMNADNGVDSAELWTITPSGDGFTISMDGSYLTMSRTAASMSSTEMVMTMAYSASGWRISNGNIYLSDLAGTTLQGAYGWDEASDGGNYWRIYELVETPGESSTKVTFTGVKVGTTTAQVGHVKYTITVEGDTRDLALKVGQTLVDTINGVGYTIDDVTTYPDSTIVTLDSVTSTGAQLVPVTEIKSGKHYLIVNNKTGDLLTNAAVTTTGSWDAKPGLDTTGKASTDSTELWTITASGDGYTISDQDGKYLTASGFYAAMGNTATALTLNYSASGWTIMDNTTCYSFSDHDKKPYYLSDNVGNGYDEAALGTGYMSDYCYWTIYEIDAAGSTNVTFTGVKAGGPTTAVIGGVTYNITVSEDVRNIKLHTNETKTFYIDGSHYTTGTINDESVAKLVSVVPADAKLVSVSEIVSGEQYLIVNSQTGEVLTDTATTITGDGGEKNVLVTEGTVSVDNPELWTITGDPVNGYTVVQNGKYLTVAGYYAAMSGTKTALKLTYSNSGWMICDDTTWRGLGHNEADYYLRNGIADANYTTEAMGSSITASYSYWDIYKIDTTPVTEVTFTGVKEGETTATVGHVTFKITVDNVVEGDISDFTNIVGVDQYSDDNPNDDYRSDLDMAGKKVTSLRITEGASFHLGVDVTDYESVTWTTGDPGVATVDENGMVTAVAAGETIVTATVVKNGVEESIFIPVVVVPSLVEGYDDSEVTSVFYYIEEVQTTDPYYTMFLSTENTTGPVEGHEMIMVCEGEVIWYERPRNSAFAWIWTADPWEGTALTLMTSTGSLAQYYPLKEYTDDGFQLGEDYNNYYKGSQAYYNIIGTDPVEGGDSVGKDAGVSWDDALNQLLEDAIVIGMNVWDTPGCDGAMSNARYDHDGVPKLVTSMTFISDPMPHIEKSVNGILPVSRKQNDFRRYFDGMTATVGEYVYFNVTITLERPTVWADETNGIGAITYSDAWVTDTALSVLNDDGSWKSGGYFYTKALDELDGTEDQPLDGSIAEEHRTTEQEITADLNKAWTADEQVRTLSFYLIYEIQPDDIPKFDIENTANLAWDYRSQYSMGALAGAADAEATITVVGSAMDNVVIDFGQTVTYTGLTQAHLKYASVGENAQWTAKYGTVTVTGDGNSYTETSTGNTYYDSYIVTYTPTSILQEPDAVQIYGTYVQDGKTVTKVINSFVVYPATTVYYEEGFMFNNASTGWNVDDAVKATEEQTFELLGKTTRTEDSYSVVSDRKNAYGYDPCYENNSGASNGSQATASKAGASTSFTFTGTGFDLYANCTEETGYVLVYVKDAAGKTVKMYTVNTIVGEESMDSGDATDGQSGNMYSLPIISEQGLAHGNYTVRIVKSMKGEVQLDGIRIFNTVDENAGGDDATMTVSPFAIDLEDAPEFYELRDYVLHALNVSKETSEDYGDVVYKYDGGEFTFERLTAQILGDISTDTEKPAVILADSTGAYTGENEAQNLLDNGPKNEIYLHANETLVFSVKTARAMQIGLKAPIGETSYSISGASDETVTGTLKSSVDMFYELDNPNGTEQTYTITITNTGSSILSVTDLKICDDPNAAFVALTEADIKTALEVMGYSDSCEDGHIYEDGFCSVCGIGTARNFNTGVDYATVGEALAAAQSGETVKLLADCTESSVVVTPGITLDLNGFKLTTSYAVSMATAHIIDSVGTGCLVSSINSLVMDEDNAMIPVYNGEGYVFTKAGFAIRQDTKYTGEGFKIQALAYPVQMAVVDMLKDGGADNNIEIVIRLTWDTNQGTGSQDFKFNDAVVASVYSSNNGTFAGYSKMFSMVVTGFESIENLKANIIVVSGTDAEYVSSTSVDIT